MRVSPPHCQAGRSPSSLHGPRAAASFLGPLFTLLLASCFRARLLPIFQVHLFLLALLHRLDTSRGGVVTVPQFDLACAILYASFPDEASFCADAAGVRRALGPAGQPIDRPQAKPACQPDTSSTQSSLSLARAESGSAGAGGGGAGGGGASLSIAAIAAQFVVRDTRASAVLTPLTPSSKSAQAAEVAAVSAGAELSGVKAASGAAVGAVDGGAVDGDAADAEVVDLRLPQVIKAKSDLHASTSGVSVATAVQTWQFDVDGYSRMSALYHRLAQSRLVELASSIVINPNDKLLADPQSGPSLCTIDESRRIDSQRGSPSPGSSPRSPAAAAGRKPRGSLLARKGRCHSKARRGSIPYSVIAAHLEQELALPPRARGDDMNDHDHLAEAPPPVVLSHRGLSKEKFEMEAHARNAEAFASTFTTLNRWSIDQRTTDGRAAVEPEVQLNAD